MSQSKPNSSLGCLEILVSVLAQTAGRDKIAKILQYGGKLIAALAAAELAAKAKRVESAAGAARKVFRLGNELAEIQTIRQVLDKEKHMGTLVLKLARGVGMYWYWVFDHLSWAATINLAKIDGPKYAYYGSLAWCVGLISTILLDLKGLQDNIRKHKEVQIALWSGGLGTGEKEKKGSGTKDTAKEQEDHLSQLCKERGRSGCCVHSRSCDQPLQCENWHPWVDFCIDQRLSNVFHCT